jgi:hypothetical protein
MIYSEKTNKSKANPVIALRLFRQLRICVGKHEKIKKGTTIQEQKREKT